MDKRYILITILAVIALALGFFISNVLNRSVNQNLYNELPIIYADTLVKPDILGPFPDFKFTNLDGINVDQSQLDDRVTVLNFLQNEELSTQFNSASRIHKFAQSLATWNDVELLSILTISNENNIDQLKSKVNELGFDLSNWKFLLATATQSTELQNSLFNDLNEAKKYSQEIDPNLFFIIDRQSNVRSVFSLEGGQQMTITESDLRQIIREHPSRIAVPETIINPKWLSEMQTTQVKYWNNTNPLADFSFEDKLKESKIDFVPQLVADAGRKYRAVHYDHGTGIVVGDVDADNKLDFYIVSQLGPNQLWKNMGDGTFENITSKSPIDLSQYTSITASFADTDNDGDLDLYVTTLRSGNRLFLNDGHGTFKDVSTHSGINYKGHSSGALFFDYDRDGMLDLFLCNVGQYTKDDSIMINLKDRSTKAYYFEGYRDAFSGHLKPERTEVSRLYQNQGDNKFTDVTESTGLADEGWVGDASIIDFNKDGWMDIYVLNMQGDDQFYENEAGKRFVPKGKDYFPKTPWGSMGIKVFDHNNDGNMDIFVTDMHSDMSENIMPNQERYKSNMIWSQDFLQTENSIYGNALFENTGNGSFIEKSDALNAENYWPWGVSTGDVNADGYEDVFIASSMNYPYRYGINSMLLNDAGEGFVSSEFVLGIEPRKDGQTAKFWFELDLDGKDSLHSLSKTRSGKVEVWAARGTRSSAIFDLDNDGDLDILTNEFNSSPMVLISNLSDRHKDINFIKIVLKGTKSNSFGIGSRVRVSAGKDQYYKNMDGKSGYLSQSVTPLYFGLGNNKTVNSIQIRWPSGYIQEVTEIQKLNTTIIITEDQ